MKSKIDHDKIEKIEKLRSIAHGSISMRALSQVFERLHHRNEIAKEHLSTGESSLENVINYVDKINEDICSLLGINIPSSNPS